MSDILKNQATIRVKTPSELNSQGPSGFEKPSVMSSIEKPQISCGSEKKCAMKQTRGTQTKAFDAIARLEKEFGKASKDLGISDKLKAKVNGASLEFQKEFYYR